MRRVLSPIVPAFSALVYITYKKGGVAKYNSPFCIRFYFLKKR